MADPVTRPTGASVTDYLDGITHPGRREDAATLDTLFRETTGWEPQMWGPTIVGYGRYDYTYESGHSGSSLATGFAPRKGNMVVYILPGYQDFSAILDRLGPHKTGKSCLYLGRLKKIDLNVLATLVRAGLDDLATRWEVHPS